jgi:hypothetical protein
MGVRIERTRRPRYDVTALRAEVEKHHENVVMFEKLAREERDKIGDKEKLIAQTLAEMTDGDSHL